MKFAIVLGVVASLTLGNSVSAQGSLWRTHYKTPISTFETNRWVVDRINVQIHPNARVSGGAANIVWTGKGQGSASAKVSALMNEATSLGSQKLRGRRKVALEIVIHDFKSPTTRVRRMERTDVGVHHINFSISVVDTKSGNLLLAPTIIEADLEALTGSYGRAFAAQRQDQKARVTQHLASVVQGFLGQGPDPRRKFSRYAQ
jgi:hypothetical protein